MEILVATRKGLLVFSGIGTDLTLTGQHFLGDPVSNVICDAAGHWYVALNLGHFGPKMHRSEDSGQTWTEIACPALPEKPEDSADKTNWSVQQVWELAAFNDEPGHLLAGTIPGAVFESNDGGTSWQLNEPFWSLPQRPEWFGGGYDDSGVHSIAIHPQDPKIWTVAVSVGGVWHTSDGGQSWQLHCRGMRADYMPDDMKGAEHLQDPHRLVQSPVKPTRCWVQHHCGIFISDDGGRDWRECRVNNDPSFGFAVAVHPHQPDTAWFVPAVKDESRFPKDLEFCVLRTRDGGESFARLTVGMPHEPAFDLVYRHALAVDSTGQFLAMGSTTGNLWVSGDEGDQWHCLSHYCPPIYAITVL